MRRDVQAIVLLLMGGAVLRISLTDTYLNYVKEPMRPFLIASGALLVVLGVLALVDVLRSGRAGADSADHEHADHEHADHEHADHEREGHEHGDQQHGDAAHAGGDSHGHDHSHGPRSAWLLLLPVLAIFLVAPPPLGAYAAARGTTNAVAPKTPQAPPLPAGDPVPVTVSSYVARAVWDDGLTLEGRTVEIVGFVTPNPAGGWWLSRLAIACCAADALASRIQTITTEDFPANTWVRVTGRWVPGGGTKTADAIPFIELESVQQVPQPKNPYE